MASGNRLIAMALAVAACVGMTAPVLSQSSDCAREAASIRRAETQLPKLEVAPPNDQQIVCITLETNILFARRVAVHLRHCSRSPLMQVGGQWQRTEQDYLSQFRDRRCKPAVRSYRG
jgi:hypothetical protein